MPVFAELDAEVTLDEPAEPDRIANGQGLVEVVLLFGCFDLDDPLGFVAGEARAEVPEIATEEIVP